jgi:hypothetical protein
VTEAVVWPPSEPVNDLDVRNAVALVSQWLRQPELPNFVQSNEGKEIINRN